MFERTRAAWKTFRSVSRKISHKRRINQLVEDEEPNPLSELLTIMHQDPLSWTFEKLDNDTDEHIHAIHTATGIKICSQGWYSVDGKSWMKAKGVKAAFRGFYNDAIALKAAGYISEKIAGGGPCPRRTLGNKSR